MDDQARAQIPVELGMVERLDAIITESIWAAEQQSSAPHPLDSYTAVISWAADVATRHGTPDNWAHAERFEVHQAATRGDLVLIEVDETARRLLGVALGAAQGIVTYVPTYGTAIGWLLDVARSAGHPAPGE
jgi:hypothetical protein